MEIVVPDAFKYLYGRPDSPIVTIPDPALRQRASEVAKIGKPIVQLCDSMVRIMSRANGVGLAAPQIAVAKRVIVVAPEGMKPVAMINPRIVKAEGEEMGLEGCLSIPGLYGEVMRAAYVEVEALDRKGRELVYELEGMHARVVQHEVDHLDGVLFIDKVAVETLHWSHPDRERAAVE